MKLDMKKLLKAIGFNVAFVVNEVILLACDKEDDVFGFSLAVLSFAAFFGINYMILNGTKKSTPNLKIEKLKTIRDYREALASWNVRNNPFNCELREAVHQLDAFQQKENSLRLLLGEQAREPANPFMSVSEDVQECLLANTRKFLNRMMILDPMDQSRFPMHNEFIHHILGQNRQLLSQYDNLIIEISQIGNSKDMENLHLDSITDALKDLRNENATMGEYGAAMMMRQGMWVE